MTRPRASIRKNNSRKNDRPAWRGELERSVQEAAGLFVRVLKALHLTNAEVISAIAQACESQDPPAVPNPSAGDGFLLGNVLRRWMDDPTFVDEHGQPKRLPIQGRGVTFAQLVRETLPDMTVEQCLDGLIKMKAVARSGASHVRLRNSATLYSGDGATYVTDALVPITELLRTVSWNLTEQIHLREQGVFQRGLTGVELPEQDLDELHRMVAVHGMSLLETLDAWANERARVARQGGRRQQRWVKPYVGVYASIGRCMKSKP